MKFADANRASIRAIEEAEWGVTPTSGVSREIRITSSSLTAAKDTVVSDELRADRMVSTITEVAANSSGDTNFEFSIGAQDEFLAAFLMGAWTRPMTLDIFAGRTIEVTGASEVTINGRNAEAYLTAGHRIKLFGFTAPANNGYFSIASVAFDGTNTVITVDQVTLTAETGSFRSRIYDANDVIVLNATDIAATATGFTSASSGFAAAIAAGQLDVGQNIFVEGLGHADGSVAITGALSTLALTISDGTKSDSFIAGTDFQVGTDADTDGGNLATAINRSELFVRASYAAGTLTLTALTGTGSITEATADGAATVTDFAGGNAVRGVYTIRAVSDAEITTSPVPSASVAAGDPVTIKGSMLRNPGDVTSIQQRSFTLETAFNDIGQYMVQDGMVPGTFSIDIATGSIITGVIGFQGRSTKLLQSTALGSGSPFTPLEATSGEVVNATTNVGTIYKDGTVFSTALQSLSMAGEANLRQQAAIGHKYARGIGAGRFNLTGSLSAYFEDQSLFEDFVNHETVSLGFTIEDLDGQSYVFTIPAVKFSQDAIAPGGIDQDIMDSVEWTAFRDPTTRCMLQIDRFSSNIPV